MLSPSDMVAVKIKQHIGNISNKKLSAVKLHTTEHLMFLQSFGQPYLKKSILREDIYSKRNSVLEEIVKKVKKRVFYKGKRGSNPS